MSKKGNFGSFLIGVLTGALAITAAKIASDRIKIEYDDDEDEDEDIDKDENECETESKNEDKKLEEARPAKETKLAEEKSATPAAEKLKNN